MSQDRHSRSDEAERKDEVIVDFPGIEHGSPSSRRGSASCLGKCGSKGPILGVPAASSPKRRLTPVVTRERGMRLLRQAGLKEAPGPLLDEAVKSMNELHQGFDVKINPVHLSFEGLSCSYTPFLGATERVTLRDVTGVITSGCVTVVMGPSGSGKSTFLDIVAMRKTVGHVKGTVKVNGLLRENHMRIGSSPTGAPVITPATFRRLSAYVAQEDLFLPTLTVAETVRFHMGMRLGPGHPEEKKWDEMCVSLLAEVGIQDEKDNLVGGQLAGGLTLRGLSGGQKRRLSIACGIVTQPALLFLDEPTSGLDAMSAVVVMEILKRQARRGVAVLCSLHQPRTIIWRMIDKLMVLSEGRLVWSGAPCEAEGWFFQTMGFYRPPESSVADWILDLVNISFDDYSKTLLCLGPKTMNTFEDLDAAATVFKEKKPVTLLTIREAVCLAYVDTEWLLAPCASPQPGGLRRMPFEFHLLMNRTLKNYLKNPGNATARVGMIMLIGLLQGLAFFQLGPDDAKNRLGSLFFGCMALSLAPYASMSLFIYDRQFYTRDLAAGLYGSAAYYWGSLLIEAALSTVMGLCFSGLTYFMVGLRGSFGIYVAIQVVTILVASQLAQLMALFPPNQDLAFALGCAYTAVSLLVSGFFVTYPSLGPYLRWAQWLAYPKYSLAALSINKFQGTAAYPPIKDALQLDRPPTIADDFWALAIVSLIASTLSILSLSHFHREKR